MYTHEREVKSAKILWSPNQNHSIKGMDMEMKQSVCYKSLKGFWVSKKCKISTSRDAGRICLDIRRVI